MAHLEELPSGTLRITVSKTIDGKKQRFTQTGTDKKELELWAAKMEYELSKGIQKQQIPGARTLGEATDEYIKNRTAILSPKTIREYKSYRRHAFQGIMDVKISKITPEIIQAEINREARIHSPKSIRNYWGLFRMVLAVELPDLQFRVKLPKKQKKEMTIPTDAELSAMLEEVRGKNLEVPLLLAAAAGLRRGEISALDMEKDIDYAASTVRISKAVTIDDSNEWVEKAPKTESGYRVVELPQWVTERLQEAVANGYSGMTPNAITQAFERLKKKMGIDIRFHDLRHYYASLMLSLGVPDKYAMKRMGHSTPNMLKAVYQHTMKNKEEEVAEQVLNALDKLNIPGKKE